MQLYRFTHTAVEMLVPDEGESIFPAGSIIDPAMPSSDAAAAVALGAGVIAAAIWHREILAAVMGRSTVRRKVRRR